ncbi:5-bromo-4-chloroindolyl phosphate hydrolysis family protein [uncultured Thiodictyon sp.]|uniref:5-bromo-4-chloroindolyl phosphate hydrolysis family protein n=1 Tax=uncultured Thiodictyon sp. TaxID=1846217 RepID=UPI0025D8FD71|nr:5-bromo-4-chloroindolyl phosphate hydrolysis family protein [uncultured Thiodictyon sp.]
MPRLLLLVAVALITATLLMRLGRRLWNNLWEHRAETTQPSPVAGLLLFLVPLPIPVAATLSLAQGQLVPFLGNAIGYALSLGGALLVRRGLLHTGGRADGRWPFKTLGCALISLATGMTTWLGVGHSPAIACSFALVALLGCYLTYGFDLLTSRPLRGGGSEHARTTLVEADRSIAAIEQASRDIRQPELAMRLQRITELARAILSRLEEDPRDLHRARKFLNVYLDGVQSVVEDYAKTHTRIIAPELNERFRRALITVEDAFREQQQTLLESDVEQLDVKIEVLTQQLKREGII